MKQNILLALLGCLMVALIFTRCNEAAPASEPAPYQEENLDPNARIKVFTIHQCEYIAYYVHNGAGITHKGNCANPIHDHFTRGNGLYYNGDVEITLPEVSEGGTR